MYCSTETFAMKSATASSGTSSIDLKCTQPLPALNFLPAFANAWRSSRSLAGFM